MPRPDADPRPSAPRTSPGRVRGPLQRAPATPVTGSAGSAQRRTTDRPSVIPGRGICVARISSSASSTNTGWWHDLAGWDSRHPQGDPRDLRGTTSLIAPSGLIPVFADAARSRNPAVNDGIEPVRRPKGRQGLFRGHLLEPANHPDSLRLTHEQGFGSPVEVSGDRPRPRESGRVEQKRWWQPSLTARSNG